jgi:biopolymer transport protein TolR
MSEMGARGRRGAVHKKPKASPAMMAEINVTPLVDVVLVLLIIFMVVTPMLSRGVDVDLPLTKNHDKKQDTGEQIVVSIKKEGTFYYDTEKLELPKLVEKVAEQLKKTPGKDIFMKADQKVKYKSAREVMEALNKGGVTNIQLATEEEK